MCRSSTAPADGIGSQVGPAQRMCGEQVELNRVANEERPPESAGHGQQHIRPQLVGLIHDRPAPAPVGDGGSLGRGTDDDGLTIEVRNLGAESRGP